MLHTIFPFPILGLIWVYAAYNLIPKDNTSTLPGGQYDNALFYIAIIFNLAHKSNIIYYWHVANQYLTKNITNVGLLQHTILTVMMSPPSSPPTQL